MLLSICHWITVYAFYIVLIDFKFTDHLIIEQILLICQEFDKSGVSIYRNTQLCKTIDGDQRTETMLWCPDLQTPCYIF